MKRNSLVTSCVSALLGAGLLIVGSESPVQAEVSAQKGNARLS
jgi:hypothetical protein